MIESLFFLFGAGFSVIVYIIAIRKSSFPPLTKLAYTIVTSFGITGMLWLSGVLIGHFVRKMF